MASDAPVAPDFIQFLFSTKPEFDCYFEVGNKSQGKPERIGAVKLMLMAHSEVFREGLKREKEGFPVKDIHPDTFKGMLKYVYGHDTTPDLCFDEADNLLYVAEKYMMKMLKNKLAVRLMKLLDQDNICSLLNNPACYTHLELNSAITEILRFETDYVLASPQFFWMNAEGFLKILEQDGLAVPEIELWRAAIKWAKHRANSEDGQLLRQQLSGMTQHLRLCTLTPHDICAEVVAADVLTKNELSVICQSVTSKRKPEGLPDFCDEIVPRKRLRKGIEFKLKNLVEDDVVYCENYSFKIRTKHCAIELLPLVCLSRDHNSIDPEKRTHKVTCTTKITNVTSLDDSDSSSSNEPLTTVSFSENVKCGIEFKIPLSVDGRNVTLLPDTKYTVKMKLNGCHQRYSQYDGKYKNGHFKFAVTSAECCLPFTKLWYKVAAVE